MSSSRVTHFFKNARYDESLLLAAKEATFAYHAAIHTQSFKKFSLQPLSLYQNYLNQNSHCKNKM